MFAIVLPQSISRLLQASHTGFTIAPCPYEASEDYENHLFVLYSSVLYELIFTVYISVKSCFQLTFVRLDHLSPQRKSCG